MQYVDYKRIQAEKKSLPEGEIFTVYTKNPAPSVFTITKDPEDIWAFGIKIKGEVTLSKWQRSNVGPKEISEAYEQVRYAKNNGWFNTQEKKINEYGENAFVYRCAYCQNQTQEIEGPCPCRGKKTKKEKSLFEGL